MAEMSSEPGVVFGRFVFLPRQRLLLQSGNAVRLGGRALGILAALVERAGEVVSKDELLKRVWPDTTVQESNLKVHIANLRQVLRDGKDGARYIVNDSGRGYCFVAAISASEAPTTTSPSGAVSSSRGLPQVLARIVGRADAISHISSLISDVRFVTIVGPGGVGKTTATSAAAHRGFVSRRPGIR